MNINFYERNTLNNYKYAVIVAKYHGEFVLVRHRERDTFEVPGGHIEEGETLRQCAKRELFEETGAIDFDLSHICDYGVERDGNETGGGLFYANIRELGPLPDTEIANIKLYKQLPSEELLTYPAIQPHLVQRVENEIQKV